MFVQGPYLSVRLLLVAALALALIIADSQFGQLDRLRSWMGTGVAPIVWLGNVPGRIGAWSEDLVTGRGVLKERNDSLNSRLLVLERRAQKYAALAAENSRLRELLNASARVDDTVVVADVIGVTPDPFSHEIIIDKGSRDGISIGQAVLDAEGLMGQVVQVNEFTARVLLISDSSHAVPVQVNRNGTRANLLGTGDPDVLELVHVPETSDIRVGDLLVSSGLGGVFPKGYPVARVTEVSHDPGEPFSDVEAEPMAQLNRSQMVLVVFKEGAGSGMAPATEVSE
ncbi:MAG: rod shape-determining protein MreC [Alteromonadaceae bacterium]|uniref:Cell shape-determining protein MreC n=1 Tax=Hydrocarboniclastica marina TaxID=2259620 RepID=A0A4P7XJN6_9ALTE|nr:rod shape-determining protein MreC [Hydrocarboniclastica marina]MAL97975.1 rod shape-determining protein MreC [Alteromonadaceae bacterium]QCF26582.1 rod shape-determining protein MreC [Hydrocarboniclastica marina]